MKKTWFMKKLIFSILAALLFSSQIFCATQFYWENPERITQNSSQFPSSVTNGNQAASFWQEIDSKNSRIYLSGDFYVNGTWVRKNRFAGPFPYSGEIPSLYSAAINSSGTIVIAVLSDTNVISVIRTNDSGETFTVSRFERQELPLVAPRIYSTANGSFILFTSLGKDEAFTMLQSRSKDGSDWSQLKTFEPSTAVTNAFLPVLSSSPEGEFVVFQGRTRSGSRYIWRLYSSRSSNGGASWSEPKMLFTTSLEDMSDDQGPYLFNSSGHTWIAWEKTPSNSENSNIYFAEVDTNLGSLLGRPERITSRGNASRPVIFEYNSGLSLLWFDTRGGNENVYLSQKNGMLWDETQLSKGRSSCLFASPLITDGGKKLSFVWQGHQGNANPAVYRLEADHTVSKPALRGVSFTEGRRNRSEKVTVRVTMPQDSSGIRGYSWVWTQDPETEVPHILMNLPEDTSLSLKAPSDREWFLKVCATDYAGNWSEPQVLTYYRDLTPPLPPVIQEPLTDEAGFVALKNFVLNWHDESVDEDIAGYSWTFQKQYNLPARLNDSSRHPSKYSAEELQLLLNELKQKNPEGSLKVQAPSEKIMGTGETVSYSNQVNGCWTFAVRSIDSAGNVSEPAYIALYINKYEPFTALYGIKKSTDILGNTSLELTGQGFTYDGTVSEIRISRISSGDPYSLVLRRSNGDYTVNSDTRISGLKLDSTVPEGTYSITLVHTDRGVYRSDRAFTVEENGTVVIAPQYKYKPSWQIVYDNGKFFVQTGDILFVIIMILALLILVFAVRGLVRASREAVMVHKEIQALITGDIMPLEKKKKSEALRKKGFGLKVKLISFTVILVLMVSLLVSLPLGYMMTRTQERTLSKGLEERVDVLLGSLSSGVRAYMPSQNVLELSSLPSQSSAMEEALFVTITGLPASGNSQELTAVWATNDQNITSRINTENLSSGVSLLQDAELIQISQSCSKLNETVAEDAGTIASQISELNSEGAKIALRTDEVSVARRKEISEVTRQLTTRLSDMFDSVAMENTSSYPKYDPAVLDRENTEYLFYRPVIYRQGTSDNYVRAIVFVSISTEALVRTIDSAQKTIFFTALSVSFFAILIGTIGSWILASIIVKPIKRLARHVTMIGNTQDKIKLEGQEIEIKSHDEIGQLGENVNEMMRDLIKAAIEEKKAREKENMELDGKAVQQAFIPLVKEDAGKSTTSDLKDNAVQIFGYYEGADAVSGDYFDYKKLDDRWYTIAKCDISGHGVPAALIMTVVATLYRKYFENWSFKTHGTKINVLVEQINAFINSLGLSGKFATLMICLFDTKTGDVYMCNAGDNVIHYYDSAARSEKVLVLKESPAAGAIDPFLVEMKGGFLVEKMTLQKNDVLFLYTDGIEEATRFFRGENYEITQCAEPGLKEGEEHGNHKAGQQSEQMEPERVKQILESVFRKQKYVLSKYHSPLKDEVLEFDFTKSSGTIDDAIVALAAVEKVFRLYKKPDSTGNAFKDEEGNVIRQGDTVRVDRKIDECLKKYFNRYDYYCSSQADAGEHNYIYYTGVNEDPQADDLTLLALRRN